MEISPVVPQEEPGVAGYPEAGGDTARGNRAPRIGIHTEDGTGTDGEHCGVDAGEAVSI